MKKPDLTFKVEVTSNEKTQTYTFNKSEFVFGRSGKADICVDDTGISREHLKIKFENNAIYALDNQSLNGVFVNGQKLNCNIYSIIENDSSITFGKSVLKLNIKVENIATDVLLKLPLAEESFEIITIEPQIIHKTSPLPSTEKIKNESIHNSKSEPIEYINENDSLEVVNQNLDKSIAHDKNRATNNVAKFVDLSIFPKSEAEARVSFKNVGLDLPKYKNPGAHAKEIIKEAEYQKHAIIKSAEVFKSRTINETRLQAKKAAEEAHTEFKKLADHLLETTRQELKKLRTDTDLVLDEKRIQANEEIQQIWIEHESQIRIDKQKQYDNFEKENKIKLDLSIEKARSDMFSERHKLLTDSENEILLKKRTYQVEFENERSEHLTKVKTYTEELNRIQTQIEEHKKVFKIAKQERDDSEIDLSKTQSLLKSEKESLEIIVTSFKDTFENHKKIENDLNTFNETKQKIANDTEALSQAFEKLTHAFAKLTEKKISAEDELKEVQQNLANAKLQAKGEIEKEYGLLKNIESKKFDDFKANELKELQKIRDIHSESIKNFSVDLSQEIATKLELLAAQKNNVKFSFEKTFEIVNSVIQIKSSINTGSESKHSEQLDSWKQRKRKENTNLISQGFAAGLIVVFALQFGYKKLTVDPVQLELARISADNKSRNLENQYTPTKTDEYYDTYLDASLYTRSFNEVYLDKANQQEWVNYATKYFLRQWKVEEEKVISVISSSNALVQNVSESIPLMKKTKLKSDLAKFKEIEDQSIQDNSQILGSNVKYEAFKKLEKEFFNSKLQGRKPAAQ